MRAAATLAALLALAGAQGASAAGRCITPDDARTLFAIALPDAVEGITTRCAAAVPGGFLAANGAALADRYRHDAPVDPARARRAVEHATGQSLAFLASADTIERIAHDFVVNAVRERIAPGDCRTADSLVALAAPLRADAMAEALLLALQIAGPSVHLPGGLSLCRDDEEDAAR